MDRDWGHVRAAGILRQVGYQNTLTPDGNPSGTKTGYGLNLTGTLKVFGKSQLNGGLVVGRGHCQLHERRRCRPGAGPGSARRDGALLRLAGLLQPLVERPVEQRDRLLAAPAGQHRRTDRHRLPQRGSYGNVNVLYYPWKNVTTGLEFVWGELEQKNGQSATDYRLQFSTKVAF